MRRDFLSAIRQLRTNFRFSTIMLLTLALGIGATTAIFSLVNGVLLQALPFREPARLVSLETIEFPHREGAPADASGGTPADSSYLDFVDWRRLSRTFEALASSSRSTRTFSPAKHARPRMITGAAVSAGFFEVLGVHPMLGRSFTVDDEQPGKRYVIISHELWASDFQSSPGVIGSHITLSDTLYTVVGVMPQRFNYPYQSLPGVYWEPLARERFGPRGWTTQQRGDRRIQVLGRLKEGVNIGQARAEMDTIQRSLAEQYPEDRNEFAVAVKPLLEYLTGDVRQPLHVLFAAVAALLLIACVNVAGLMLARGFTRNNEFAVRVALGAKASHIIRQVLIESTVLACCAGVVGIAFAFLLLKMSLAFAPGDLPRLSQVRIDGMVLAFASLISLLTGVCFGVVPAWVASHSDSSLGLWRAGRGIRGSRNEQRLHGGLVIAETAISLILLAGSGLLIRSFVEILHLDPGFDAHHLLVFYVGLTPVAPKDKANAFFRQLLPEVSAIPGVQSVGGVNPVPFDYERGGHFSIARRPLDPGEIPAAAVNLVEPRYFETMRIPLLKGRTFNERDTAQGKPVAIVNEEFARMFFPTEDALGKYIQPDLGEGNRWNIWCEIVGVVRSVRNLDLTQRPRPQFYLPYEQESSTWPQAVILRVAGDPEAYVNTLRATVAGLDRELPIFETFTVDELIAKSMSSARFEAQLLTCFAVCALLLAAVGLYAALSEMVARRTFEIGLRVALGAQRGDVFQFVVRRGLVLALIGLTLGLAGFAMAVRFVAGMLYGVRSFDPLTLMGVSAILLCVSLLASAAPAWRATRLEPTAALREQ